MRRTVGLVAGLLLLGLSGCAGEGLEPAQAVPAEPAVMVAEPCALFSASDLAAIFGTEVRAGRTGISRIDDAAIEADSRHCRWSADALDASLQIADASDFDSGEFVCLAPADPLAVEAALGTRAWWSELTASGVTAGRLRVCTDSLLIDITIVGDAGAASFHTQAELMGRATLLRIVP